MLLLLLAVALPQPQQLLLLRALRSNAAAGAPVLRAHRRLI
jgi:hypothetical protein